ncbi:MAG: hypothetical protein K8R53_15410, partial [Bacteroidales bacterium]|nr:hypothetical protein [Bacteroidales bacterium]
QVRQFSKLLVSATHPPLQNLPPIHWWNTLQFIGSANHPPLKKSGAKVQKKYLWQNLFVFNFVKKKILCR